MIRHAGANPQTDVVRYKYIYLAKIFAYFNAKLIKRLWMLVTSESGHIVAIFTNSAENKSKRANG
jgi:hypothetical protein